MFRRTFALVILAAPSLSGCMIADHYKAEDRMEKSQDAYRACVVSNPPEASKCVALKAIYEEDRAAYNNS